MKRASLGIAGAVIASVALMLALRAQEQASGPSSDAGSSAQAPAATAQAEQVVFTFSDEEQMRQFAQLWQQRQAIVTRMTVLQTYWDQEQAILGQINQQLLSQYNLDVNKNYSLDPDRKVLIERSAAPTQPTLSDQATLQVPAPSTPQQPQQSSTPTNP